MELRESACSNQAMISTPHPLATAAGLETLIAGGSAVDAAIAANAVLGVTMVDQCGLGGDLFALIFDPQSVSVIGFNGSGASPRTASIQAFQKLGISQMPMQGALSITVPGAVDAWLELSQRWGKLPWSYLFGRAVEFASQGFKVTQQLSDNINLNSKLLHGIPRASDLFLTHGKPLEPGVLLHQPELAELLKSISSHGREAFYHGAYADLIAKKVQNSGGILQAEDLTEHHGEWVKPLSAPYRDTLVYGMPPNAPGVLLLSILTQLNQLDLSLMNYQSPEYILLLSEIVQHTLLTGRPLIADPRLVNSGWENLLNGEGEEPNNTDLAGPYKLKGDNIALCVVDSDGMGITLIQSIYHDFGSGVYVDELGLFLQNRGSSFSLDPSDHNCLAPGKRPAHTLCPAMVCNENGLLMTVGSRGGNGQPQTLTQVLSGILDFGLDPQTVLDVPRWVWGSTTAAHKAEGLVVEDSLPPSTIHALKQSRTSLQITASPSVSWMGCAQAILIDQNSGQKLGAADMRGGGLAQGY